VAVVLILTMKVVRVSSLVIAVSEAYNSVIRLLLASPPDASLIQSVGAARTSKVAAVDNVQLTYRKQSNSHRWIVSAALLGAVARTLPMEKIADSIVVLIYGGL
jgi:hypothetical protein